MLWTQSLSIYPIVDLSPGKKYLQLQLHLSCDSRLDIRGMSLIYYPQKEAFRVIPTSDFQGMPLLIDINRRMGSTTEKM
jgi:hypothetical protein